MEYLGRTSKIFSSNQHSGRIWLEPDLKTLYARVSGLNASGNWDPISETLDFSALAPDFQPLTFDLPKPFGSTSILVAGFTISSGAGRIERVDLDFASSPSFSTATIYEGSGFQYASGIVALEENPNRIFVLDKGNSRVMLCNTVSDVCVELANAAQSPELLHANRITLSRTQGPGVNSGYLLVAHEGTSGHHIQAYPFTPEAIILDLEGDGVVEWVD